MTSVLCLLWHFKLSAVEKTYSDSYLNFDVDNFGEIFYEILFIRTIAQHILVHKEWLLIIPGFTWTWSCSAAFSFLRAQMFPMSDMSQVTVIRPTKLSLHVGFAWPYWALPCKLDDYFTRLWLHANMITAFSPLILFSQLCRSVGHHNTDIVCLLYFYMPIY